MGTPVFLGPPSWDCNLLHQDSSFKDLTQGLHQVFGHAQGHGRLENVVLAMPWTHPSGSLDLLGFTIRTVA